MIKAFTFLVALRQLQAFFSPQPLDFLVIDVPAFDAQQLGDFTITVPPILFGEPDQRQAQGFIISAWFGLILL